jgi:hypothetical protein
MQFDGCFEEGDSMGRRHRREIRLFARSGSGRRNAISLADSGDYWPLTIVPSTSRPKRPLLAWIAAAAVVALGVALVVAVQRGIPAR